LSKTPTPFHLYKKKKNLGGKPRGCAQSFTERRGKEKKGQWLRRRHMACYALDLEKKKERKKEETTVIGVG